MERLLKKKDTSTKYQYHKLEGRKEDTWALDFPFGKVARVSSAAAAFGGRTRSNNDRDVQW